MPTADERATLDGTNDGKYNLVQAVKFAKQGRLIAMDDREDFNQPQTNITPQRKAVALKYEAERDMAPRVIAKGRGHVAEHILETAQKNAIPVYKDKTLVNMLMALEIDREIPPELYKAIAEVMAYVYKMDKAHGQADAARRLAAQRRRSLF